VQFGFVGVGLPGQPGTFLTLKHKQAMMDSHLSILAGHEIDLPAPF
jgi:hypothetical protein